MNLEEIITNAPYNTMNIPQNEELNLQNPQINQEKINQEKINQEKINQENSNNFYDPTIPMVEKYLKTNSSMYDNRNKYFDSYLFNKKFDEYIKDKNDERVLKQNVQLYDLDRIDNIKIYPYQLPINKLLINLKNVWFNLFDNIILFKNPLDNFTNDNLFYYGISFIGIYILFIMVSYIFE